MKAPFSFSEDSGHFFVLEYMPGGDLGRILEEEVYLEEHHAKFYIAEIVLAIEHLHNKKIIHRDLKPENLVIDSEGHLKLTDFGLSDVQIKKIIKQAKTLSGGLKNSRNRGISDKNRRKGLVNEN